MLKVVESFRKGTDVLFVPLLRVLARWKVHPNTLTFTAFVFGVLAVIFFEQRKWFALFVVVHLLCDKLDGALARFARKKTKQGFFLDHASDRIVECLLLLRLVSFVAFAPVVVGLFIVYNLVFLVMWKDLFFARTIMFILLLVRWYEVAVIVAGAIYVVGLLVQVKEILLNAKRVRQ